MVVGGYKKYIKGENTNGVKTEFCDLSDENVTCIDQDSILYDYGAPPLLFKVEKDYEQVLYNANCF